MRGRPRIDRVCPVCGEPTRDRGNCLGCADLHKTPEGALIDGHTRFHLDRVAQDFVAEHPAGATLEEVGEVFALTRERIRQIEAKAMRRLVARLRLAGVVESDVLEMLAAKPDDNRSCA